MQVLRLILLMNLLSAGSLLAAGKERVVLAKSFIVGNELEYFRPCNSRAVGILLSPTQDTLQIGVVMKLNPIQCSTIPIKERISIPFASIKPISLLNLGSRPLKLRFPRVTYLHHGMDNLNTTVGFFKACGTIQDFLFASNDISGRVNLSIASISRSQSKVKACATKPEKFGVSGIKWKKIPQKALSVPYLQENFYNLRITSAKKTDSSSVTYRRGCNEAPISLITNSVGENQVSIGVLLASYPNIDCYSEKRIIDDSLKFKNIFFDSDKRFGSIKPVRLDKRWIVGEINSALLSIQPKIKYLRGCETSKLSVYTEKNGKSMVGSLIRASECRSQAVQIESSLPFTFISKKNRLFQLRLKGR